MRLLLSARLITFYALIGLWFGSPILLFAQTLVPREALNRPSQRWIPVPREDWPDAKQQPRLLQLLRDQLTSPAASPLSNLTDEQLQQLEEAFSDPGDPFHGSRLPNLAGLPQEWLDSVQNDPSFEMQAQRLLEQFTRSRRLPPFTEPQGTGTPSLPFPLAGEPSTSRRLADRYSDSSNIIRRPPGEFFRPNPARSTADWRRFPTSPPADLQSPDEAKGNEATIDPEDWLKESSFPPLAPGDGNELNLADLENLFSPKETAPDAASAKELLNASEPGAGGSLSGSRGSLSRPNAPTPIPKSTSAGNAAADIRADGKLDIGSLVKRHGLAETLRRIVEKTLEEQGNEKENENTSWITRLTNMGTPSARGRLFNTVELPSSNSNLRPSSGQELPAVGQVSGNSRSATDSGTASTRPHEAAGNLVADLWQAIQSVPTGESTAGQASTQTNPDASNISDELRFHWDIRAWLSVLAVAVITGLSLLLRRSLSIAAAEKSKAEICAKELLQAGIRTRADVVRAFHQFVLHTARPFADWWSHRQAALRLADSAPHLTAVVQELTNVYEQARYLPPDIELTTEQILRVERALHSLTPPPN